MNHKNVSLKTHCGQTPHHLPPNAQRQNHRLRPNAHLNTPRGLMAHLLNLWKPTTSKKETDAASAESLEIHDATERETKSPKLEKPENWGSMSASAKTHWKQRRAKYKPGNTRF